MKKIDRFSIFLFGLVFGLMFSCVKEEVLNPAQNGTIEDLNVHKATRLGKKLENPYSVENMRRAFENMKSSDNHSKTSWDEFEIITTHLYIKFKPQSEEELAILKKDSTLILFSYPLDYEIIESGDFYHDPSIPHDRPTYLYTAIPVNKKLPEGVGHEILSELFIPDEDKDNSSENSRFGSSETIKLLVDEALRLTGNLEEESNPNLRVHASKWRPAGRVRVWDDRAGRYVPVVGVGVRAKRWFTFHEGMTNSQGFFTCDGTFERQADYSIQWEKYHFSVRSGTFGQAEHNRSDLLGDWNPDFGAVNSRIVNDNQHYYALIFQAAQDYYYGGRFGLSSPPRNSTWHPQVKIAANVTERQNEKPSHAAMYARTGGIFPTIYVRKWEDRSDEVYAVTIHELAHAAHWDMDREAFRLLVITWGVQDYFGLESAAAVVESWAEGVEWQFAQERYRNLFGQLGYEYDNNYQLRSILRFPVYTPIVVDMIDNENQRFTRHLDDVNFPIDRVSGYTILQIQEGLRGATSWHGWRNNMINRHNNPTEVFLNELFANWH